MTKRVRTPYDILTKAFNEIKHECGFALTQVYFETINANTPTKVDHIVVGVEVEGVALNWKGETND